MLLPSCLLVPKSYWRMEGHAAVLKALPDNLNRPGIRMPRYPDVRGSWPWSWSVEWNDIARSGLKGKKNGELGINKINYELRLHIPICCCCILCGCERGGYENKVAALKTRNWAASPLYCPSSSRRRRWRSIPCTKTKLRTSKSLRLNL